MSDIVKISLVAGAAIAAIGGIAIGAIIRMKTLADETVFRNEATLWKAYKVAADAALSVINRTEESDAEKRELYLQKYNEFTAEYQKLEKKWGFNRLTLFTTNPVD